jgi:poly(3-hydroxyalkanoate) synthetase
VDVLQTLFALDDPLAIAEKFRRFGHMAQDSDAARLFVAIEDWLNDGVPLSGVTARELLDAWFGENLPVQGEWRVAGLPIDPASIDAPALVAAPRRDRIVPPGAARALAASLPSATLWEPDTGHVGMIAGRQARTLLWEALRDWLLNLEATAAVHSRSNGTGQPRARSQRQPARRAAGARTARTGRKSRQPEM